MGGSNPEVCTRISQEQSGQQGSQKLTATWGGLLEAPREAQLTAHSVLSQTSPALQPAGSSCLSEPETP